MRRWRILIHLTVGQMLGSLLPLLVLAIGGVYRLIRYRGDVRAYKGTLQMLSIGASAWVLAMFWIEHQR